VSLAAADSLPPPFFALHFRLRPVGRPRFTCLSPPPPLFTFDASVLPSAAFVISLPPLPGSGKTEHRFCAFLPPSRRPFLGPVRRISRLYFCRVFQPQAARR